MSFLNSVAVVCPQLPEPINSYMNCSSEEPTVGTFCTFSCHEGHQLEDLSNRIVICNYNGSWSGEVAVCQGKQLIATGIQICQFGDQVRKTVYNLCPFICIFSSSWYLYITLGSNRSDDWGFKRYERLQSRLSSLVTEENEEKRWASLLSLLSFWICSCI